MKIIKKLIMKLNQLFGIQKIPDILNNLYIENTSKCNLKCKFCAYDKRDLEAVPYETMSQDMFENVVNQALKMGYKNIGLTPTTGDVFMDKKLFSKITNFFSVYYFYLVFAQRIDNNRRKRYYTRN